MIDLGKQWPLNISFFADKCKCLGIANLDATEPSIFGNSKKMPNAEKQQIQVLDRHFE